MQIHRILAGIAILLGFSAALAELAPSVSPRALAREIETEADHIDALDLAERIMKSPDSMLVFDVRTQAEYEENHIPTAQPVTIDRLARESIPQDKTIVVYSEGSSHAAQAWVLLRLRGYRNVLFLREGLYEWMARVDQPRLANDATAPERQEFERAAKLSRFFGGTPMAGVLRAKVPTGYWTTSSKEGGKKRRDNSGSTPVEMKIRRQGC